MTLPGSLSILLVPLLLLLTAYPAAIATKMGSKDCSWEYYPQPLSHFARGIIGGGFQQRLCIYEGFWKVSDGPVFFYTGNESPVEEYCDNNGFIWDLAEKYSALVVFAEHRYFGESVPNITGMDSCMAYISSQEALADYLEVISYLRRERGAKGSRFVAFGGSYGGMLSAWLRMLFPSAVDGALAASAPILGFPLDSCPLDSSARAVTGAASPSPGQSTEGCADNLKASYVLIFDIGKTSEGRQWLSDRLELCSPLQSERDVQELLSYLQTPLFNLAEGSYPFPSDYITFALTGTNDPLPPWAMQTFCDPLGAEFDIKLSGDTTAVNFTVSASSEVEVYVDWTTTSNNEYTLDSLSEGTYVAKLLMLVTEGIQIWYNVSGTEPSCIRWDQMAPNANNVKTAARSTGFLSPRESFKHLQQKIARMKQQSEKNKNVEGVEEEGICTFPREEFDASMGWFALTCNEGLNLVNWWVQGVGNDLYWPPNQEKDYSMKSLTQRSMEYCEALRSLGLHGTPIKTDSWSLWEDAYYGGSRALRYASNIVFSNGNLDPWYPAGVSTEALTAAQADQENVIALLIDRGGHHVDLFSADENDPESVTEARTIEEEHIKRWLDIV